MPCSSYAGPQHVLWGHPLRSSKVSPHVSAKERADHLFRACRLPDEGHLRRTGRRHPQLRGPRSRDVRSPRPRGGRRRRLWHVAQWLDTTGNEAELHPVNWFRHRSIRQNAACGATDPSGKRGWGQCAGGFGACDVADPGAGAPPARGARQPGASGLARYDRRSGPARGRTHRQNAADYRPGAHRRPARAACQGVRDEGDRLPARSRRWPGKRRTRCTR